MSHPPGTIEGVTRIRHHVVSAGYLRLFADGERLRLISKSTRQQLPKLVGVKDAFVSKHFNSVRTDNGETFDDLESEWTRLETWILPVVRNLAPGSMDGDADLAVKTLMAIHFARSYAVQRVHSELMQVVVRDYGANADSEQRLAELFELERGRQPEQGELAAVAFAVWEARQRTNEPFVQTMVRAYNFALTYFKPYALQFAIPDHRWLRLGTGDNPLVVARAGGLQLGALEGLPLGDADAVYMPLRPDLGVSLTKPGPPQLATVNATGILQLNNLIWRNCHNHVACHPAHDWHAIFNL